MIQRGRQRFFSRPSKRTLLFLVPVLSLLLLFFTAGIRVNITGNYDGIFLLKGEEGALFELKDDLFLGDGRRYIAGIDFEHKKEAVCHTVKAGMTQEPYLYFEWNARKGVGFVRNYLPGGRQLLTNFSRFAIGNNREVKGLFVGGGLPADVFEDDMAKENATGMAYYDGAKWFHIWCTSNEAIFNSRGEPIYPLAWKYLGSRVLHRDDREIMLESSHEVMMDDVPFRIDRRAYFRAGDTYFVLAISVRNIGGRPAMYTYVYGDEPWVGNYGTSGGNVGWAADGLHDFTDTVDTTRLDYAGFFDYGNDETGEGHNFTWAANFIKWFGESRPLVWFANSPFDIPASGKGPLNSNERSIAVEWGPRTLQPGQSETYTVAIGMADHDAKSGFPVIPRVELNYHL